MLKRQSTSTESEGTARKRSRLNDEESDDDPIVAGKLLGIRLTNFMCHGSFKLDFNQRINLILGHNGSGKSGILTAIIIGLGGTAKATNRSNTLSKLVKNGESSAVIEIHICNSGSDAFEPEIYGDSIIVIRTILERGGGHYKILNSSRNVVSKSKTKLDVILRYFEITVNNPITILTQDCARTFLRDSDEKARFKLFKKGCGLETIEEEMSQCVEIQRSIEIELKRRKEKTKYFKEEYKEKMKKFEMLESAEKARERTIKLERELKWVAILKEEKSMQKLSNELEKRAVNLSRFTEEIQELSNKKAALEDSIRKGSSDVAKIESGRETYTVQIAAKRQALQEKRNEFFGARKRFLGIDSRVKQLKADITQIEENISEITDQNVREVHEQEVANLELQKEQKEREISDKSVEMEAYQKRIGEMEEKVMSLQQNKVALSRSVAHCREQLNQIQNETDNLAVYGSHIPQLVKLLERNANKFSVPPLGPIGRYLEVPNQRYKSVIEQMLNAYLSWFIVNTPKDHELFLSLFNKEFPGKRCPGIIQRKFRYEPYDTSQHEVKAPRQTTTPLQQLKCKNMTVLNTIIDMVRIEQILICEDMEMGRKLTENVENVPKNLKRVIVMQPLCEMYPQPNFRIYSLTEMRCNFIQVSAEEKRAHLKEQFDEENIKFEELKKTLSYTENVMLEMKQARKKLSTQVQAMERTKRELINKISDIKDQFLGPRIEEDTLNEEKTRLERQLEDLTVEYAPQKARMDELTAQLTEIDDEIKKTERLNTEYESKVEEMRERVNGLRDKLHRLELSWSEKASVLQDLEQRVTSQRSLVDGKQEQIAGLISAAGERIETAKTEEEVREEISRLNAHRQVSTQITETREEIMEDLQVLEEKITELKTQYDLGKETLSLQVAALAKHEREYEHRKRVVKIRMSERFREILAQQSYSGDLRVKYDTETLELEINPRQSGTVQGTKSLSGGERSFSTVAFLMAIWSCIEHPFFLLDEYDVFTDGSNRELMTRMLIQEAMAKPKNQYMFLTPQDVSHLIKPSAELAVYKMPDKN